MCDSATACLLDFSIYTGKSDTLMPHGLGYVVWSLGQPYLWKNHHFYYDNFFSSVKFAQNLLDYGTDSCSTIKQNRKKWPTDLSGNLEKGQSKMNQIGNLVACWWRDKRVISTLSANASPDMGIAQGRTKDGHIEKLIPQRVLVYTPTWVEWIDMINSAHTTVLGQKATSSGDVVCGPC
ncbi:hypothetical protein RRG08_005548 [Elysia crispata]|uniref:PiggyBac transposable element-derived protein domain-containing protein n=1 Tax=Elysia crispata TaxID=231223 RepID=A0AAE1AKV7_9GAST|nr:hypothetical protein RRG08_005548 [Elysia crispata]